MTVFEMVRHGRFPYIKYPFGYTDKDSEIALLAIKRTGLFELCDRPINTLSGGVRQIAYVAMALAQDTDYILLDEPTTYLDINHQLAVMRLLKELSSSGKGIVAVMHDLPMAFSFSDEVAVLSQGRIIAQGPPSVISSSTVVKDTFGVVLRTEASYTYEY